MTGKQRQSKLDPFTEKLEEMDQAGVILADMQGWLKTQNCDVSLGRLSGFLEARRTARLHSSLLDRIASGARQCQEVEKQFGESPPPELETLIKLNRVMILNLSTRGAENPELLKLADQLTRTALEFASGRTKAELEQQKITLADRRISLLEKKAAQADATANVLQAPMTEAEKSARIKEIYGL